MLCPFCLSEIKEFEKVPDERYPVYRCTNKECGEEIPPLYIDGYRKYPPVIVSLVGFQRHGKTVFVASLFRALEDLSRYWRGFYYKPLDEHALDTVRKYQEGMEKGELPPPSHKMFPKPLLVRLVKMPILRPVTLVIYDQSGEAFDDVASIRQNARYIKESPAVLFVHSISPVDGVAVSLRQLLARYVLGMAALGATKRKQHLVVALTKTDEVTFPLAHGSLQKQLADGSLADLFVDNNRWRFRGRVRQYLRTVLSRFWQLKEFLAEQAGGDAFLAFANDHFRSLGVTLLSAIGSAPVNGRVTRWQPKLVLDPLLFVIHRSIPWWRRLNWRRWFATAVVFLSIAAGTLYWCHTRMGAIGAPVIQPPGAVEGEGRITHRAAAVTGVPNRGPRQKASQTTRAENVNAANALETAAGGEQT